MPALRVLPVGAARVHVTPELKLPVPATVAVNCWLEPRVTVAGLGVMETEVMDGPVGVGVGDGVGVAPPPQDATKRHNALAKDGAALQTKCFMMNLPICAADFLFAHEEGGNWDHSRKSLRMTGSFYASQASVVSVLICAGKDEALVVCWG